MYMSQHLQYFGLQGSLGIFDPMVRKQIFNVANKVYCGQEIIPGIGPRIPVHDNTKKNTSTGLIQTNNLYFNLTRPFGYGKKVGALMEYKPSSSKLTTDLIPGSFLTIPENNKEYYICSTGNYK